MKVRLIYPTRAAMETRAVPAFSTEGRTPAALDGRNFVCVFSGDLAMVGETDPLAACERLYAALNKPEEWLDAADREILRVVAARVRQVDASHTSLSVGDVVEVDMVLYVCASFGFERIV